MFILPSHFRLAEGLGGRHTFRLRMRMTRLWRPFSLLLMTALVFSTAAAGNVALPVQALQGMAGDSSRQAVVARGQPGKPRTALFHNNQMQAHELAGRDISWGWLVLGFYVLSGLLFGGLSSYHALGRGRPPLPYFLLGFCLNLPGYILLLIRTPRGDQQIPPGLVKVPKTHVPLPCSHCGHPNHPAAKKCAACGSRLQPAVQSDLDRLQL